MSTLLKRAVQPVPDCPIVLCVKQIDFIHSEYLLRSRFARSYERCEDGHKCVWRRAGSPASVFMFGFIARQRDMSAVSPHEWLREITSTNSEFTTSRQIGIYLLHLCCPEIVHVGKTFYAAVGCDSCMCQSKHPRGINHALSYSELPKHNALPLLF